ncbi:MAG: galactose-1-phosphate uridylyltransferase [Candidatus Omnitrophica bacterium]|nr:galactose-1-phosphate uridylyltransferase [Candidatus Omnitrophota bacterium]MDD5610661.1 galactose-1-phosphate uridylyltransferase [Candidatus Omnitrophota bacterium]
MSELRYNLITRDWVIIATERAKRPKDFLKAGKEKKILPEYRPDCPFCPGNEAKTPGETLRLGSESAWKVRSVYNLFGALSPDTQPGRKISGIYLSMQGSGNHEVIIEHPRHDMMIPLMKDEEVGDIIRAYKNRYLSLASDKGIEAIIIFKNHGSSAGTSLEHPHSQLVATPIVPPQIRSRVSAAMNYFDSTGRCIFCKTLEEELKEKARIVLETDKFVSFMPYASYAPFMTWIFPRRHVASFGEINDAEIKDLAINLKNTLQKLYYGLDNPDFNYAIRSMPVKESGTEYLHWYLSIIPRLTQPAGFELGSGIFINTSLPEESAEFLRQVKPPSGER